jgi:hypothetical protein
MEGRPTEQANSYYDIAIQVITSARHGNPRSTNDILDKMAWGQRSWLMGDQQLATALRATYVLLEQVDKKLDRLEQAMRR